MNYYYLDAGNQPVGPLSLDVIRQKATAGEIAGNPMIAPEGADRWEPLSDLGSHYAFHNALSESAARVVRGARDMLSPAFIQSSLDLARTIGHHLVTAAGVLGVVYGIYAAIKAGSLTIAVSCLVLLVALAFAHFAARRFFGANEHLLTPSRVSSAALLECIAALMLIAALSMVVTAILMCIRFGIWQPLLPAVCMAIFWTYFAAIALHPETVNVEVAAAEAGEQAVGLLAFFLKAGLKLVPLIFLAFAALGCLVIALSFFGAGDFLGGFSRSRIVPLPANLANGAGFRGLGAVIYACLLPLLAHLLFIAASLPLDLWRAILSVPRKLDALKH